VERQRRWRYFGWKSQRLFASRRRSLLDEYKWILDQGPISPGLVQYLEENREEFDLFVFFTYLYYPTVFGIPAVADRAVMVPTAHDEPAIHLSIFRLLFHLPRFFSFNTEEEKQFVQRLFHNDYIPHDVIGIGIDLHPISVADDGYLLYAGRVETGKRCEEMFEFCRKSEVPLKVIGQMQIPIPASAEYLGFVSEAEKESLFERCKAVVLPSRHESLSLTVLEAWAHGKPVVVSAESPVLRAHVAKSGGGYLYSGLEDFKNIIGNIDPRRGELGRKHVEQNYSWDAVLRKYEDAFARLSQGRDCAR
jgi:glycosyltransferase involved in cell wall biosynthesis